MTISHHKQQMELEIGQPDELTHKYLDYHMVANTENK